MVRFDFKRLIIAMALIFVINWAASWLLASIGIYGLVSAAIVDFVVAFALVLIYTPSNYRRYALRTTTFHYNVLMYFVIFFIFTLLQWIL